MGEVSKNFFVNVLQSWFSREFHQSCSFYNSLNTNDQDALDSAAGGNFLDKMPREGLAIIESKSKVRYSRSRPNDSRAITNAPSSTSSPSNNSFEIQQMAALLEDKMNIRMSRLEKAIYEKNVTTPDTSMQIVGMILSPSLNQGNLLQKSQKELKVCKSAESSIDETPDDDEKTALIKVLKSRKQAIAWKLSDIKGINPEFCSHKILMEDDYEPAVQHQRRVNPKIHDVIKKERASTDATARKTKALQLHDMVEQLETHLHDLYLLNSPYAVDAFKPAFRSFFGEEHQTFKLKMFHNLDQLRLQLERENLHGVNAKTCLQALRTQFKEFFASKGVNATDLLESSWHRTSNTSLALWNLVHTDVSMKENELNALKENGSQLHDEILHEHQIKSSVKDASLKIFSGSIQASKQWQTASIVIKSSLIESENHNAFSKSEIETQMQRQEEKVNMREAVDAGLVVTESSGTKPNKQDTSRVRSVENADLKAQIQEKVFANAALNNELRKLKGNIVDSKFTKASILGKPPLQPSRNHLVVRQPNAFTSERPRISRPGLASQC
ncbi:hypothetical protein Tco_1193244 [Tanacetum coccineum]